MAETASAIELARRPSASLFYRVGFLMLGLASRSVAQTEPATIPTVVAQALSFEPSVFGRPRFFDGRTPPDWPATLLPGAAKVIGGGVFGDSVLVWMRVAVFEFSAGSNPEDVIKSILARAGYGPPASVSAQRLGGFAETEPASMNGKYCKDSSAVTFGAIDSVRAPLVVAMYLISGEAGRQNCNPRRFDPGPRRFPVTIPRLTAPAGAMSVGGGSSFGDTEGSTQSVLRTTMSTDSLLAHYTTQLVTGGWKPEGRPASGDGIGAQRFSFREGQDAWVAALVITAAVDRRQILLQVSKAN